MFFVFSRVFSEESPHPVVPFLQKLRKVTLVTFRHRCRLGPPELTVPDGNNAVFLRKQLFPAVGSIRGRG